jgi:hypothetical protein
VSGTGLGSADAGGIQFLVASLGRCQDAQGWEEFRRLMTSDCVLRMPDREYQGPDAISGFLRSAGRGQHMLSIPRILPLSASSAQVETPQMFFPIPGLIAAVAGSYQDVVVREESGGWLLAQRTVRQAWVRGAGQ